MARQAGAKEPAIAAETEKFRTTPITASITRVRSLPKSAIIYRCAASQYWQFRVFLEGKQRKRSTKEADKELALKRAKLIYAEMLSSMEGAERRLEPSSKQSLQTVANSLWERQQMKIAHGELHKDKNKKNQYVYERHIKPFFGKYDIKEIDADALERFRYYLAEQELGKSTQLDYLNLMMVLLKEAQRKSIIAHLPARPTIKLEDEVRGYFDKDEYTKLWQTAKYNIGKTYEFKDDTGRTYRKVTLTQECFDMIMFMRHTYIRPTDIKVIKHRHVHKVERSGITFIELRHPATKGHKQHMASTEFAWEHYQRLRASSVQAGFGRPDDYLFAPDMKNRDSALAMLTNQFSAVLDMSGLKADAEGKNRTLYSLRHTAIVTAIRQGVPISIIAPNARTSELMINRFYGSHIKSALDMGSVMIDVIEAKRERYAKKARKKTAELQRDHGEDV
jgi:Phage integrase SAM-like domain